MAFPESAVDGNDVLAVYDAAFASHRRARSGEGPTLLECKTYRWYGHSEIDPDGKYRIKEEVEAWKKQDPIVKFEKYLTEKNILTEDLKKQVAAEITAEIDEAVTFADESPFPDQGESAALHVWS